MPINRADTAPRSRRALATFSIVGTALGFTLLLGVWPQIYTFATNPAGSLVQRLLTAPIHLSDDVMLTLRSGEILLETGSPSFNRTDSAQASTSYLAPYLAAALRFVFPLHASTFLYALLGLIAVLATFAIIVAKSRSLINASIVIAALALTVTHLQFALNGWDHLIQGFVFALGIALALSRAPESGRLVAISLLAAAGALMRPDGLIIAIALLWVALISSAVALPKRLFLLVVPFGVVTIGTLTVNYLQFGFLTPTTARLKTGAAPSMSYVWQYFLDNSIFSYTALSLLLALLVIIVLFASRLPLKIVLPLTVAAVLTAGIAAVNSDFFSGARMFWVPAVVLATTLTMTLPGVFRAGPVFSLDHDGRIVTRLSPQLQWGISVTLIVVWVALSSVVGLRGAVVSKEALPGVRTAELYLASQWINQQLDPEEGSVGVFFAGVADHLVDFEAADFLGKADEDIATTTVQWGPPGHNKWDIEETITKWRPQAIMPTIDQDPLDPTSDEIAEDWRANLRTHGYVADLITSPLIRSEYRYCRVPDPSGFTDHTVDIFLRNDIASRYQNEIDCP